MLSLIIREKKMQESLMYATIKDGVLCYAAKPPPFRLDICAMMPSMYVCTFVQPMTSPTYYTIVTTIVITLLYRVGRKQFLKTCS